MRRLQVIDSHTGGEPTRVVIGGGPELTGATLAACRDELARHHDWVRTSLVCEPRGSEVMVGAYLCPPREPHCVAGVIFFNNAGYLGMCGHGLIGVVTTLVYEGRIGPGAHRIDTPVGVVTADVLADGRVSFENVPCFRYRKQVRVPLGDGTEVEGDVAWGGNWFFLVTEHGQEISRQRVSVLTEYCKRLREALNAHGITGENGGEIDHLELFGPVADGSANSKNFVLCPGGEYDRSPCGTGTSAKLACLATDGKLAPGEIWRQASIVGSVFEGTYRWEGERVVPRITGRAYVNGEFTAVYDDDDPFVFGLRHE
jgi:4-hydroxyproline epimerase